MHTIKEEIKIIICLILYGVYIYSIIDITDIILKGKQKYIQIIIYIVQMMIQLYITFKFSYQIMDGYVPIYFMLFIIGGIYLYKIFFKKTFIHSIKIIKMLINKIYRLLKPFIYSKKVLKLIRREIKIIKNSFIKKIK